MVFMKSFELQTIETDSPENKSDQKDDEKAGEKTTCDNDCVVRGRPVMPDGGWGWVVCLTATLNYATVVGCINSSSNFYVYFIKGFPADDAKSFETAWVTSLFLAMTLFMGSLAGILNDRFGFQKVAFFGGLLASVGMLSSAFISELSLLYLTFGVLVGTGFAFSYSASVVVLAHYFDRRLGLSHAIVTCGGGVLSMGYTWAVPALYQSLGLKNTLLCCSGFTALVMLYALTWKPIFLHETVKAGDEAAGTEDHPNSCCSRHKVQKWLNVRIWRQRRYVVWLISVTIAFFGYFVFSVHMVKFCEEKFPQSDSHLLPIYWVAGTAAARLTLMPFADRARVRRAYVQIHQAVFFLMGSVTMVVPLFPDARLVIAAVFVCGICDGFFFVLIGPIAKQLVGVLDSSQAVGFLFGAVAIPFASGPALAGLLYDYIGSYNIVFHVFSIPLLLASMLLFIYPCLHEDKDSSRNLPHSQTRKTSSMPEILTPSQKSLTPETASMDEPNYFNMEQTVEGQGQF